MLPWAAAGSNGLAAMGPLAWQPDRVLCENQEIITTYIALVFQNASFPAIKSGSKFQIPIKKCTIPPLATQNQGHTYTYIKFEIAVSFAPEQP